ncbi:MAG: AAA family ATPase, partial [Gammaproteobacteria bacterium]|nr:AAA family ATPase [Gammaproteobacteria bacterium]
MIRRSLGEIVAARLLQFPAVALIGPRQVGKTTLARWLAGTGDSVYLDLEDPSDLSRLDDAAGYLRTLRRRLVVIDEVQRAPGLFQLLRVLVDERIRTGEPAGQFLLLGSAAPDLLRQSGESLAGRIAYLELSPLDVRETGGELTSRLWVRGGFPPSFLAESDWQSAEWREQFIRT